MRKTVEIEYVGIEDVQEIMDDAYALIKEGHYVSFSISGADEAMVTLSISLNGFNNGNSDYSFIFYMSDNSEDVHTMNKCKSILNNLLVKE